MTLTEAELREECTRCTHTHAVHTGGAKAWGWAIYEDTWANGKGTCSETFCTCERFTDDPAATPAPPRTFTPPAPQPALPCGHWDGTAHCGATPTRPYVTGWRCDSHTPTALAAQRQQQEQDTGEGMAA